MGPSAAAPPKRESPSDADDVLNELPVLSVASSGGDVCAALMSRYGRSSAPQHRHLLASAAALRSLLNDEGLPLTPGTYLAAAVTALRNAASGSDPQSAAAVATLLSIVLPLVSSEELTQTKVKDATAVAADVLGKCHGDWLPTGTVRSLLKSLGFLSLHVDQEDWEAVEGPLRIMLGFAVDRRPKVRRGAQECAEKLLCKLRETGIKKKANGVMLGLFADYISSERQFGCDNTVEKHHKADNSEIIYMLNLVSLVTPSLSRKECKKVFTEVCLLLSPNFDPLTRQILRVINDLLLHVNDKFVDSNSEYILPALISYISSGDKNPADTIISAVKLLEMCMNKLPANQPSLWVKMLPPVFEGASGLLLSESFSGDIARSLQNLIKINVSKDLLAEGAQEKMNEFDSADALRSICSSLNSVLSSTQKPSESILMVVSYLFLRLGSISYDFMKDILMTLSSLAISLDDESSELKKVHECIGAAVTAVGPEKVLSVIPIAINEEKLTCSNSWLISILDDYIIGASLQYFLDFIVPLAKSIKVAGCKAKKASKRRDLKVCADSLWSLLPAFCRYPVDIRQNFGSVSKLLISLLKQELPLQVIAAGALKGLVERTKKLVDGNEIELPKAFTPDTHYADYLSAECYAAESAVESVKILASHSADLLSALADALLESPSKIRACMKDALGCVASITDSECIQSLFVSQQAKFNLPNSVEDPENLETANTDVSDDKKLLPSAEKADEKRCLLLELIYSFAEAATEDLLNMFFGFIQSCLLNGGQSCHADALLSLSIIVKEHSSFCLPRLDEILLLLHSLKGPLSAAILKGQLSCYQYLLVHMLKAKEVDIDKKAFLILNQIILALKSKKESRKLAYDVLLDTSTILKSPTGDAAHLQRLLTMVMGYLSSPSHHISSGAIAALSLLMHSDATFCLSVPNLVPSVLALLQSKAKEVIKAGLGFVKVLVSSLHSDVLVKLQADILNAILPWSAVSKFHFRSKVSFILEILIRKSGVDAVSVMIPQKYKTFFKRLTESRQAKRSGKEAPDGEESTEKDSKKRKRDSDKAGTPKKHSKPLSAARRGAMAKHKNDGSKTTGSRPSGREIGNRKSRLPGHTRRQPTTSTEGKKRKNGPNRGNLPQQGGSTKKRKLGTEKASQQRR